MPHISDKRLCLDESGERAVDCEDPAARSLLVGEGGELSDADAKKYGLTKARESSDVDNKARPQAENKARQAPAKK